MNNRGSVPWPLVTISLGLCLWVWCFSMYEQAKTNAEQRLFWRRMQIVAGVIAAGSTLFGIYAKFSEVQADERVKEEKDVVAAAKRAEEDRIKVEKERAVTAVNARAGRLSNQGPPPQAGMVSLGGNKAIGCVVAHRINGPWGRDVDIRLGDDGHVKVSAVVRGRDGTVVGKINNNEWSRVAPNCERNYSPDAFEIIGPHDEVILQVVHRGGFVSVNMLTFIGDGIMFGASDEAGWVSGPEEEVRERVKIQPIFRYPSDLHLGERLPIDGR